MDVLMCVTNTQYLVTIAVAGAIGKRIAVSVCNRLNIQACRVSIIRGRNGSFQAMILIALRKVSRYRFDCLKGRMPLVVRT